MFTNDSIYLIKIQYYYLFIIYKILIENVFILIFFKCNVFLWCKAEFWNQMTIYNYVSENAERFLQTQSVPEECWILMTEWYDPQSVFSKQQIKSFKHLDS